MSRFPNHTPRSVVANIWELETSWEVTPNADIRACDRLKGFAPSWLRISNFDIHPHIIDEFDRCCQVGVATYQNKGIRGMTKRIAQHGTRNVHVRARLFGFNHAHIRRRRICVLHCLLREEIKPLFDDNPRVAAQQCVKIVLLAVRPTVMIVLRFYARGKVTNIDDFHLFTGKSVSKSRQVKPTPFGLLEKAIV